MKSATHYWLLKTEPSEYSIDHLIKDKKTLWEGVANPQAKSFLKQFRPGDAVFIYHTGKEKAVVGTAIILREASDQSPVPTIGNAQRLKNQTTLKELKTEKSFQDFLLIRQSRLSVMPVPEKIAAFLLAKNKE